MGEQMNTGEYTDRMDIEIDLRRRRSADLSARIVRRAQWLVPEDRELVLAVFERGQSAISLGTIRGQNPRHIRKRIRQLVARLDDPRLAYVVAHHNAWGRTMRNVARELFIRGRPMREVSDELGVSLHRVRQLRDAIEAMAQTHQPARISRTWLGTEREGT